MGSLGFPHQVRKRRLGHSKGGVTENCTHTFAKGEREAARKLGELFGTGGPEMAEKKLNSVPNLSQEQEGPPDVTQEAFVNQ